MAINARQDVRQYAAEQNLAEDELLESGLKEKAEEFTDKGSEVYAQA